MKRLARIISSSLASACRIISNMSLPSQPRLFTSSVVIICAACVVQLSRFFELILISVYVLLWRDVGEKDKGTQSDLHCTRTTHTQDSKSITNDGTCICKLDIYASNYMYMYMQIDPVYIRRQYCYSFVIYGGSPVN